MFLNQAFFKKLSFFAVFSLGLFVAHNHISAQEESASSSTAVVTESDVINIATETASTSASTTEQIPEMSVREGELQRTERVDVRQELLTSRQRALESFRQERIINLGANISNRMEAAIERLFSITTRLEQRILKLQTTGQTTTLAEAELKNAATLLAEARAELNTIDETVYAAATSPEPYTAWQTTARVQYESAGEKIRAAFRALQTSISLLKTPTAPIQETAPAPVEDPFPGPIETQ